MLHEKKKGKAELTTSIKNTYNQQGKKKLNARRRVKDLETNLPVAPEEDTISISQSSFFL